MAHGHLLSRSTDPLLGCLMALFVALSEVVWDYAGCGSLGKDIDYVGQLMKRTTREIQDKLH